MTMPQDIAGWIVVLAALALGYVIGRASGRSAANRDRLAGVPPPLPQPPARPSPELIARVEAELANGHLITAVKLLREGTGMGLKEAKEAVERMTGKGQA
jgi:ribosomal protein L7/L12